MAEQRPMETISGPKKVQYAVWEETEGEAGYWLLFDRIEDAVSHAGDGIEVYRMEAKLVGRFKRAVKTIRIKRRKRKKVSHG